MQKMQHCIDTLAIFKPLHLFWALLGINTGFNKHLCSLYDVVLTVVVTFGFPIHLMLGVFTVSDQEEFFINLVIGISSVACTSKHLLFRYRFQQMNAVYEIFEQLDARVHTRQELEYFRVSMARHCNFMTKFFARIYFAIAVTALLTAIVTGELLYPAFIPLDWRTSLFKYFVAILFQFAGLTLQIVQNLTNDLYGPMTLCMLAGHVHLLAMRVSSIGYNNDDEQLHDQNYKTLITCIEDYKLLKSTSGRVERILSFSYIVQFAAVGINVCVGLIYLLFFASNWFAYTYYCLHITAILIELFPCCYYGTILEEEFWHLSYAIFSSNWSTQPRPFRRNLVTFTEQTLRAVTILAGGMIRINLDSFFATCKTAYSFFTVIQNMK